MPHQTAAVVGGDSEGSVSVLQQYAQRLPSPVLTITTDESLEGEFEGTGAIVRVVDNAAALRQQLPELFAGGYPSVVADGISQPVVAGIVEWAGEIDRLVLRARNPVSAPPVMRRALTTPSEAVVCRVEDEESMEWVAKTYGVSVERQSRLGEEDMVVVSGDQLIHR